MRLVWIRITKYRRFSETQTLRFAGKLTALVGPNEAGKTSLLEVLAHLGHDGAFRRLDVTRGEKLGDEPLLVARFFLEPTDLDEISHIPGSDRVRWLEVAKYEGGQREFVVEPALQRDLTVRRRAADQLKRALEHRLLRGLDASIEGEESTLGPARLALRVLDEDAKDLRTEDLHTLRDAASSLERESIERGPKYISDLPATLRKTAEVESQEHPSEAATEMLRQVVPNFLMFDDANRDLKSSYDLSEVSSAPSQALSNLVNVASLNLPELFEAVQNEDQAEVNTIQERANERLAEKLGAGWSQSGVRVMFRADGGNLYIQIRDTDGRFSGLDERSDGLRQFVALLAFCTSQSVPNPILLIDEAETHLHYDAQADLIDMLAKQQIAKQVIYTTHSTGCLPEDLGTGIRRVSPIGPPRTTSKIQNKFWRDNEPGLTPLLFGMGAATLAFLSVRSALLVEGPSDCILLPHLFRAVSGRDHLGFQVVPGLSTTGSAQFPLLRSHGSRVLYLVDNDKGGERLRAWLEEHEVHPEHIVQIAPTNNALSSVEDALDSRLFRDSVNRYLSKWSQIDVRLKAGDLPRSNRMQALTEWCERNGHAKPGKVELAYEVVDLLLDDPSRRVVERERALSLRSLLASLARKFGELGEDARNEGDRA